MIDFIEVLIQTLSQALRKSLENLQAKSLEIKEENTVKSYESLTSSNTIAEHTICSNELNDSFFVYNFKTFVLKLSTIRNIVSNKNTKILEINILQTIINRTH